MKSRKHGYPEIRREFKSVQELADLINRSQSYVKNRMNGRGEFSENEKRIIRMHIRSDSETLFTREKLCS